MATSGHTSAHTAVWMAVFTTSSCPWTTRCCPPKHIGAISEAVDHAPNAVDAAVRSTLRRQQFSPIHSTYYHYYFFITT